jgi:hypothetical protein
MGGTSAGDLRLPTSSRPPAVRILQSDISFPDQYNGAKKKTSIRGTGSRRAMPARTKTLNKLN